METCKRTKETALRDDGFSALFYFVPPCTAEEFGQKCVDWLDGEIQIKEIGMGAGEARTYHTAVGDIIGEAPATMWWVPDAFIEEIRQHSADAEKIEEIYARYKETPEGKRGSVRLGDFYAFANVRNLIKEGTDPFEVLCSRAHRMGMRVWGREELRGGLPKRLLDRKDLYIPGTNKPDYKYETVRKYREDIFAEIAAKGADGVSVDFCVYPPYLENPERDAGCITQFFRELRARFARDFDRKIEIVARLPREPEKYGLLWRDWIREGVVDVLIPSVILPGDLFDVPIDEYVEAAWNTSCRIFGCLRPKITNVDPDERKGDEERGIVRLNRPVTIENDRARAALLLQSGADGIQIALGTANKYDPTAVPGSNRHTDQWKPHYAQLVDWKRIQFEDKTYPLVNSSLLSAVLNQDSPHVQIPFRITDDPRGERGGEITAFVCPVMRNLRDGEELRIRLNGSESIVLRGDTLKGNTEEPTGFNHAVVTVADEVHFGYNWWSKGRKRIEIDPLLLRCGENLLEIEYESADGSLEIVDVDIEILYGTRPAIG